ncbi:MAG: hypothetical protein IPM27_06210 [Nitrosomonadales bacterium]|nr:hypothetical protein [Nitrosomonadales bacterium]
MMQPKIVNAERLAVFHLPAGYAATLLGNVESAGIIEYHYVMVVFGPDQQICMFTGSEWSNQDPSYKNEPVFGIFGEDGHAGCGGSPDWLDPALFVLRSVDAVKERFSITDPELSEAEAWGLTQILKRIQELPGDPDAPQKAPLWAALSKNDARLVEYMKKGMGDPSTEGAALDVRH